MRQYAPEPRTYELMTILTPDLTEENLPSAVETVGGYITSTGGELQETLTDSPWGRRRLAYPIRHGGRDLRDGFYSLYHFLAQPSIIGEIERELKLNTDIIRYLVTRYEPVPVEELNAEEAEIAAEDEAATAYAAARASSEAAAEQPSAAPTAAAPETGDSGAEPEATAEAVTESVPQEAAIVTASMAEAGDDSAADESAPETSDNSSPDESVPEAETEAEAATPPTAGTSDTGEEGLDEPAKES